MSMFMCPAVHTMTHSLLRSSSTHEPSDPPLRVINFFFFVFNKSVIIVFIERNQKYTNIKNWHISIPSIIFSFFHTYTHTKFVANVSVYKKNKLLTYIIKKRNNKKMESPIPLNNNKKAITTYY